jgi:hypothetical protein
MSNCPVCEAPVMPHQQDLPLEAVICGECHWQRDLDQEATPDKWFPGPNDTTLAEARKNYPRLSEAQRDKIIRKFLEERI